MIRSLGYNRNYGWWQFVISKARTNGEGFFSAYGRELRKLVRNEGDVAAYHAEQLNRLEKWEQLKRSRIATWVSFVGNDGNPTSVHPILWNQSKTGEVNITEFKDKFKEAIARFLAGAVQWDIIRLDNVMHDIVLI